jgi:hypothetical protein
MTGHPVAGLDCPGKDLTTDERWVLVSRVAASRQLAKAAQLRELLLYLAERAIHAPAVEMSEQEIGSRVLGRRPDYDPQSDNIVRVQIRHLRQKLDEYFDTDGRDERIRITIPKGSRVPQFDIRTPAAAEAPASSVSTFRRPWGWLAAGAVVMLASVFLLGRFSADPGSARAAGPGEGSENPFWAHLFARNQETTIVLADSNLAILQDALRTSITLNSYIDGSYRKLVESAPDPQLRSALALLARRQYTSLADATVSGKLYTIGRQWGAPVAVRYARNLNIRDFASGNFILIGSRRAIPWIELFERDLNFIHEQIDGQELRFGFRNRSPRSGESALYSTKVSAEGPYETFAVISMLPNTAGKGSVLMFSGTTMEGTEAAGEFVMSSEFPQAMRKVLGGTSERELRRFEILLRIAVMAGAPHEVEVLAWRKPA